MIPVDGLKLSSFSCFSDMDDERVVELAKAGSARAAEYLLRKYRGFVESKARSYFLAGGEDDDVVQEGMIGLYKAIRDYRCDRFTQFRTFAEICVTRQIITAVKSAMRNKHSFLNRCVSLQSSVTSDDDERCLLDFIDDPVVADPEDVLLERYTQDVVRDAVNEDLSSLECDVLKGYLEGRTYQEISGFLGRSPKAIDNALQRAKRKVGRKLCEAG